MEKGPLLAGGGRERGERERVRERRESVCEREKAERMARRGTGRNGVEEGMGVSTWVPRS